MLMILRKHLYHWKETKLGPAFLEDSLSPWGYRSSVPYVFQALQYITKNVGYIFVWHNIMTLTTFVFWVLLNLFSFYNSVGWVDLGQKLTYCPIGVGARHWDWQNFYLQSSKEIFTSLKMKFCLVLHAEKIDDIITCMNIYIIKIVLNMII